MKTKIIFIFLFLFLNSFLYAQEKPNFINTPEELSQDLFKSIYENTFFIIPEREGVFKENEKVIGDEREVKRVWQGSKIKKIDSKINDITLYFRPKELRKFGDVYLSPFSVRFDVKSREELGVFKGNTKPLLLPWKGGNNTSFWIRTNDKSDIQIFVPRIKNLYQSTKGFLLCQRAYKESALSKDSVLEDVGYEIEAVKISYEGETESTLLTGSSLNGKLGVQIMTTNTVSPAKIDKDESMGKSPNVSITYYPEDNNKKEVQNDDNITMGLKFLYSMQYQSGVKKTVDYTNYAWIKKEDLNLPLFVNYKTKNNTRQKISLGKGKCYSVIFGAKIIDNTYSKGEF